MNVLRTMARSIVLATVAVVAVAPAVAGGGATDIGAYRWTNLRPTVPFDPTMWAPRAGLQALELRNDLYVMGGQTNEYDESTGIADAWRSSDGGLTWTEVPAPPWEPRGMVYRPMEVEGKLIIAGGGRYDDTNLVAFNGVFSGMGHNPVAIRMRCLIFAA